MANDDGSVIIWTREKVEQFKKAYADTKGFEDNYVFVFDGREFVKRYAGYLIEFLGSSNDVTERYAKPEPADTNTEPITNMRTESEIRARVQQLLNIRDEIIQLSGVPEWARSSTAAVAAIDDVISQLNWVLGENG